MLISNSRLEDAEEKIDFLKAKLRKQDLNGPIQKFNMFSMPMADPYEFPAVSSARDSKLQKPEHIKKISRSISHKLQEKEEKKLMPTPSKLLKDPHNSKKEDNK